MALHIIKKNFFKIQSHLNIPFFNNAYSLIALQVLSSVFGFLFWIVAARVLTTEQVGVGTALLSATTLLVSFAILGLDDSLTYYLPRTEDPERLINVYFSVSIIVITVFSIVFVLGQEVWAPNLGIIRVSVSALIIFCACTIIFHFSTMQDSLFVAERMSNITLLKGLIINLLRPLLFVLVVGAKEWSLLLSITFASLSGILFNWRWYSKSVRNYNFSFDISINILKPMLGFSVGNYITNLVVALPNTIIPLIVLHKLGPVDNAYFFVGLTVAGVLGVIGRSFGVSLFVEGGRDISTVEKNTIRSLSVSVMILFPCVLVLALFPDNILSFFGKEYSQEAYILLRQLVLSSIPLTIHGVAIGVMKAKGMIKELIFVGINYAALHIGGSLLLMPYFGLEGIGIAFIVARTISAVISIFLAFKNRLISIYKST